METGTVGADGRAVAEIDIEIFDLGGPRTGERGFDTAAERPTSLVSLTVPEGAEFSISPKAAPPVI